MGIDLAAFIPVVAVAAILWEITSVGGVLTGFSIVIPAGMHGATTLLMMGIAQRAGWIEFSGRYELVSEWYVMALLVMMNVFGVTAGVVPGGGLVMDLTAGLVVRPIIAGMSMAAAMDASPIVTWIPGIVWFIIGGLLGFVVISLKTAVNTVLSLFGPFGALATRLLTVVLVVVALVFPFLIVIGGFLIYRNRETLFGPLRVEGSAPFVRRRVPAALHPLFDSTVRRVLEEVDRRLGWGGVTVEPTLITEPAV